MSRRWRLRLLVCVGVAVGLAAVAGVRLATERPARFGTLEQVVGFMPPEFPSLYPGGITLEGEALARAVAARGHYRGGSYELDWFLQSLAELDVPASEGYDQKTDPFFSPVLNCIAALGEAWDQAGPYPTRRDEVEAQMLRFSEHPVAGIRGWVGAVLVAMDRTGSLSDAGRKRLEELRGQEIVSMGIHNLAEYRLIRHRERQKAGDKP